MGPTGYLLQKRRGINYFLILFAKFRLNLTADEVDWGILWATEFILEEELGIGPYIG